MTFNEVKHVHQASEDLEETVINCQIPGCCNSEYRNKQSIVNNIKRNGLFKCRSCSYTEEGRKRISKATSYLRSEETKQKMSESRKRFYQTPEGEENKKMLSKTTAKYNSENLFEKSKRRGLYNSDKNGRLISYGSSYELMLCEELEYDTNILSYETQVYYETESGGARSLDFLIKYKSGKILAVEIKPKKRLYEQAAIDQVNDSKKNATKNGWDFEIYTEDHFGLDYKSIRDWADEYRKNTDDIDLKEHRMELNRKKAIRFYNNRIKNNKITTFCEYCNESHDVLAKSYTSNLQRNGRYICEREGGHIAGSKPKKKKENPYLSEGKKECLYCKEIKTIDCFGADKTRQDGLASRCKECRCKIALEKYHAKKEQI